MHDVWEKAGPEPLPKRQKHANTFFYRWLNSTDNSVISKVSSHVLFLQALTLLSLPQYTHTFKLVFHFFQIVSHLTKQTFWHSVFYSFWLDLTLLLKQWASVYMSWLSIHMFRWGYRIILTKFCRNTEEKYRMTSYRKLTISTGQ